MFLGRLFNVQVQNCGNLLPNDEHLDGSKLKAFADDRMTMAKMMTSFDILEKIVGKGENAVYQHFLLFPQCFQKPYSSGLFKLLIV